MSETSPDLQGVKAQLREAIRRDHEALKANLSSAIRRDHIRRKRRRKAIRTGALSLGVLLVLSGSALAAGDVLGVIELGGGVNAVQVSTLPVWNGTTGTFITGTSEHGSYVYHLTGGSNPTSSCGPTDPNPTNDIYVTSTRPLTSAELKEILDRETSGRKPRSVLMKEMEEGKLPNGAKWLRRGRHPMIGGGSTAPQKPLPSGVTGVSNGCPTPGVASQPGTPGSPATPGKAGVTEAPSDTRATP
jgi:hypothetical protein